MQAPAPVAAEPTPANPAPRPSPVKKAPTVRKNPEPAFSGKVDSAKTRPRTPTVIEPHMSPGAVGMDDVMSFASVSEKEEPASSAAPSAAKPKAKVTPAQA